MPSERAARDIAITLKKKAETISVATHASTSDTEKRRRYALYVMAAFFWLQQAAILEKLAHESPNPSKSASHLSACRNVLHDLDKFLSFDQSLSRLNLPWMLILVFRMKAMAQYQLTCIEKEIAGGSSTKLEAIKQMLMEGKEKERRSDGQKRASTPVQAGNAITTPPLTPASPASASAASVPPSPALSSSSTSSSAAAATAAAPSAVVSLPMSHRSTLLRLVVAEEARDRWRTAATLEQTLCNGKQATNIPSDRIQQMNGKDTLNVNVLDANNLTQAVLYVQRALHAAMLVYSIPLPEPS